MILLQENNRNDVKHEDFKLQWSNLRRFLMQVQFQVYFLALPWYYPKAYT